MFSTKARILTAVALTASLVPMAQSQQPPPRRESMPRRPASATVAPAVQSPSRAQSPPQAASDSAGLPDTPEAVTPREALAPVAIAGEPSAVQVPTAARTPALPQAPLSAASVNPQSAGAALAPVAAASEPTPVQAPSAARRSAPVEPASTPFPNPQSAVPPLRTQPASAHAATPSARLETVEPPQQRSPRAAQTRPQPAVAQTTPVAPRSPDYVEEKGFKGRVFEIKHRDPDSLGQVLRPLGSGFKGATISSNREFKILTVRDFPENIAAMEEAIKRLDTPEARSPDIEFTVHIIIASSGEGAGSEFPADLGPVMKQLQSTLRYKTYNLMTSAIHRGKEGPVKVENSGIAESKLLGGSTTQGYPIFFNYSLQRISLDGSTTSATVQVGDFSFHMRTPLLLSSGGQIQYENIGFNTPVSVREGEKVVVGTTSMGDKGLIVVVSAKVLK